MRRLSLGSVLNSAEDQHAWLAALKRMSEALIKAEPEITRYDQIAGDGDAGLTLKAGAEGEYLAIMTIHED